MTEIEYDDEGAEYEVYKYTKSGDMIALPSDPENNDEGVTQIEYKDIGQIRRTLVKSVMARIAGNRKNCRFYEDKIKLKSSKVTIEIEYYSLFKTILRITHDRDSNAININIRGWDGLRLYFFIKRTCRKSLKDEKLSKMHNALLKVTRFDD